MLVGIKISILLFCLSVFIPGEALARTVKLEFVGPSGMGTANWRFKDIDATWRPGIEVETIQKFSRWGLPYEPQTIRFHAGTLTVDITGSELYGPDVELLASPKPHLLERSQRRSFTELGDLQSRTYPLNDVDFLNEGRTLRVYAYAYEVEEGESDLRSSSGSFRETELEAVYVEVPASDLSRAWHDTFVDKKRQLVDQHNLKERSRVITFTLAVILIVFALASITVFVRRSLLSRFS